MLKFMHTRWLQRVSIFQSHSPVCSSVFFFFAFILFEMEENCESATICFARGNFTLSRKRKGRTFVWKILTYIAIIKLLIFFIKLWFSFFRNKSLESNIPKTQMKLKMLCLLNTIWTNLLYEDCFKLWKDWKDSISCVLIKSITLQRKLNPILLIRDDCAIMRY